MNCCHYVEYCLTLRGGGALSPLPPPLPPRICHCMLAEEENDKNRILPCCQCATLAMLLGDVDALVGYASVQIRQAGASKHVKPILS